MGANSKCPDMDDLCVQNVMKYHGKKKDIKDGVAAATGSIAECLPVHQFGEGRIKEINTSDDPVFKIIDCIFHEPAKIHVARCRCNQPGNYYFCKPLK